VFALLEGGVVGERPGMASVDLAGADVEVVAAQRRQAFEHPIDIGLAGDESIECDLIVWALAHGDLHRL
jgi:hypothetical protein